MIAVPLTSSPRDAAQALALLDRACAALADVQAGGLDDGAVAAGIVDILRGVARLQAQCSRFVRVFEQRRAFGPEALSMVAWLRRACHLTGPAASNLVETARRLPSLPEAQSAFERGDIGLAHAQVISRLVDDVGLAAVRPSEDVLVEAAQSFDAAAVRQVALASRTPSIPSARSSRRRSSMRAAVSTCAAPPTASPMSTAACTARTRRRSLSASTA